MHQHIISKSMWKCDDEDHKAVFSSMYGHYTLHYFCQDHLGDIKKGGSTQNYF